MPFKIKTEEASTAIQAGLKKRKAEIHFPKKFTLIMKFLSWLPYWFNGFHEDGVKSGLRVKDAIEGLS